MKKNSKLYITVTMITALTGLFSCQKFVLIDTPKNQLVGRQVFADSIDARAAISGIYINMINAVSLDFASGGMTLYPGMSADEMNQTSTDVNLIAIYNNTIQVNNSYNNAIWSSAYKLIYNTNACIDGLQQSIALSTTAKASMIAEARGVRAFIYFNLVNLYGPVPIITSTDFNTNRLIGQSTVQDVYEQIKNDLLFCQANLPHDNFVTSRVNYYAATALLAKVSLYTKDYTTAQSASTLILNSGKFALVNDLNAVFLASSQELIWKLVPVFTGRETWEGYFFVPSSTTSKPKYIITNGLYNSFEANDQRKIKWINANTVSGVKYPYPYKYKKASTSTMPTENYSLIRLAEIYLIRAEARANLTDLQGSLTDLNVIRNRAGLISVSVSDQNSLLTAIEKERQAELFCEGGNRWFDLKRTNRANDILSLVKSGWKVTSQFYPIPINEITANPNLVQNIGY